MWLLLHYHGQLVCGGVVCHPCGGNVVVKHPCGVVVLVSHVWDVVWLTYQLVTHFITYGVICCAFDVIISVVTNVMYCIFIHMV